MTAKATWNYVTRSLWAALPVSALGHSLPFSCVLSYCSVSTAEYSCTLTAECRAEWMRVYLCVVCVFVDRYCPYCNNAIFTKAWRLLLFWCYHWLLQVSLIKQDCCIEGREYLSTYQHRLVLITSKWITRDWRSVNIQFLWIRDFQLKYNIMTRIHHLHDTWKVRQFYCKERKWSLLLL